MRLYTGHGRGVTAQTCPASTEDRLDREGPGEHGSHRALSTWATSGRGGLRGGVEGGRGRVFDAFVTGLARPALQGIMVVWSPGQKTLHTKTLRGGPNQRGLDPILGTRVSSIQSPYPRSWVTGQLRLSRRGAGSNFGGPHVRINPNSARIQKMDPQI